VRLRGDDPLKLRPSLSTLQASILSAKVDDTIRELEDVLLDLAQNTKAQTGDALLALHQMGEEIKTEIEQRRRK
jgi:hypothetical protein